MSEPGTFLTAEWRDLVIANYAVPATLLHPFVPRGTTLDSWDGQILVSLVGFRFVDTRVRGFGVPGHRDFEEVNLRFYVRHRSGSEVRRGVVFLRELVPRRVVAWTARALYNEPYRARPMRHAQSSQNGTRRIAYEWREGDDWLGVAADTHGPPGELRPGSRAEFITEHFWAYTRQRHGGTAEYRVAHPPWSVWETPTVWVTGDLGRTYGRSFGEILRGPPESAYVAVGSPVVVFRPRQLGAAEPGPKTG